MTVISWPTILTPESVETPQLVGGAIAGSATLTGRQPILSSDFGYWMVSYGRIPVTDPVRVAAYRATIAKMRFGSIHVRLPIYDIENLPWPSGGWRVHQKEVQQFSDATLFTDGTGWTDPYLIVKLNSSAGLRDTSIEVFVEVADTIREGMLFSLPGDRVHMITGITTTAGSPAVFTWKIQPPLREDYAEGSWVNFENAKLRAMVVPQSAEPVSLKVGRYGFANLTFREAFA